MIEPLLEHPKSIGEGYLMHMFFAWLYSFGFFYAGAVCFIHGIFPFLFQSTASAVAITIINSTEHRRDES